MLPNHYQSAVAQFRQEIPHMFPTQERWNLGAWLVARGLVGVRRLAHEPTAPETATPEMESNGKLNTGTPDSEEPVVVLSTREVTTSLRLRYIELAWFIKEVRSDTPLPERIHMTHAADPTDLPAGSKGRHSRIAYWIVSYLFGVLAITLIVGVTIPALATVRGGEVALVRKDVKDLTTREKSAFVNAILKAKSIPAPGNPSITYYDQFVQWHRDAFLCENAWQQGKNWAGAAHNSPTFFPWHREYLIRFEEMLRTASADKTITVPYWDWTDPDSTAAVFADDFMGGEGDPAKDWAVTSGPFRKGKWSFTIQDPDVFLDGVKTPKPYLVRHFNVFFDEAPGLPTKRDVKEALQVSHYDHKPYNAKANIEKSFRNNVEGWRDAKVAECKDGWLNETQVSGSSHAMHNLVHIYTGGVWKQDDLVVQGTMAYNTAPNDPLFFVHHANVDRIWSVWELQTGGRYRPQTGAELGYDGEDTMWPWYDRSINSWSSTLRNGYRYD